MDQGNIPARVSFNQLPNPPSVMRAPRQRMEEEPMDFPGGREWCDGLKKVLKKTSGIEQWVGVPLYVLGAIFSPPTWLIILFDLKHRWITDVYVVGALVISVGIYLLIPNVWWCALLSTLFSASTVIVLLNVVLLSRVFGPAYSPERSLLLFICNAAQITFMFATWYYQLGERQDALFQSILTFATISHVPEMPRVAMTQIATDILLLAIYLSQLIGRVGGEIAVD
jgi:hypothetical protein